LAVRTAWTTSPCPVRPRPRTAVYHRPLSISIHTPSCQSNIPPARAGAFSAGSASQTRPTATLESKTVWAEAEIWSIFSPGGEILASGATNGFARPSNTARAQAAARMRLPCSTQPNHDLKTRISSTADLHMPEKPVDSRINASMLMTRTPKSRADFRRNARRQTRIRANHACPATHKFFTRRQLCHNSGSQWRF